MPRNPRPAQITLRLAAAVKEGLEQAAFDAGCSLNAYATQVLATAVGDPARFRAARPAEEARTREIPRDEHGFPLDREARRIHIRARDTFFAMLTDELGADEARARVRRLDVERPAAFVEWFEEMEAEQAGLRVAPGNSGARGRVSQT